MNERRVYFIKPVGLEGPVKIGCSVVPTGRVAQLMTWSPFPLEVFVTIPGSYELEANLHQCLATSHSHGEWFKPTKEVLELMWKLRAGVPVEQAIDLSLRGHFRKGKDRYYSPEKRLGMSYAHKVRWAVLKQEQATGQRRFAPSNISRALDQWGAPGGLSAETIALIEEFLADPAANCLTWEQYFGEPQFRVVAS